MPTLAAIARATTAAVAAFNGTMQPGYTFRGYEYIGCAAEGKTGHALQSGWLGDDQGMTIEKCLQYCGTKNMPLSGLEFGKDCYCGKILLESSTLYPNQAKCDMNCPGNSLQNCGGSLSLSIFNNTKLLAPKPPSKVGTWAFESCYMELQGARVLPDVLWVKNGMTLDMCTSYCATNGKYKYGGVENGNECFCGNNMTPGAKNAYDLDCPMTCDIPCGGNDKQICGGNGVITVYRNTV
ncbi:hypothetical protein J7T55_006559 [Diaporthe amygdali]|uniref:uncharacterized protein n=1 Tax=Phomopsis amygdali TaxID=1214568 RepID=UPI0022FDE1E6|nr:uncharacterized protein J7T55_006559 [Diaporthe amygdali]KAJ0125214.1 hypothetical protein J7T55_006559 [Diaporthe amygdali]